MTVVLGDVIGSRRHESRDHMWERLAAALEFANARAQAVVEPLMMTIGDEFQAVYDDVFPALDATLLVRIAALPEVDVRFGVATGPVEILEPGSAPFRQDGPAWWTARAAIQKLARNGKRPRAPRGWRTFYAAAAEAGRPSADTLTVNAYLLCRDELVSRMDDTDVAILRAAVDGSPQTRIAEVVGLSQSAVSQRMARNGHNAVLIPRQALRRRQ